MGEPICERWVAEEVAGKTFAEVGGLWGTVNEQVTAAARAGAAATTMIDLAPSGGRQGRPLAVVPRAGCLIGGHRHHLPAGQHR